MRACAREDYSTDSRAGYEKWLADFHFGISGQKWISARRNPASSSPQDLQQHSREQGLLMDQQNYSAERLVIAEDVH
jgi:hypothetical protein